MEYLNEVPFTDCTFPIDMSALTKLNLYICKRICFSEGLNALTELTLSSCVDICFAQSFEDMSFGLRVIENNDINGTNTSEQMTSEHSELGNNSSENENTNITSETETQQKENQKNEKEREKSTKTKTPFLSKLKVISLYSSEQITIAFDTTPLERIEMAFNRNIVIRPTQNSTNTQNSQNEIIIETDEMKCQQQTPNFKKLFARGSSMISLPAMSFENKKIFIEECKMMSFNNINPVEYMNVGYDFLQKKMQEQVVLPDVPISENETNVFIMRRIHCSSEYVHHNGNVLSKAKEIEKRMSIPFWSRNFYNSQIEQQRHNTNQTQQKQEMKIKLINENGTIEFLPDCIHYFELTLYGMNILSIGVSNPNQYAFGNEHIGWHKGSIGYHSDDGQIYNDNGYGEQFGLPYGLSEDENHIVGCGYDLVKKELFFTKDGVKNPRTFSLTCPKLFAGFAISDLNKVEINYGDKPFLFDLKKEYIVNGYLKDEKDDEEKKEKKCVIV